MPFSYLLFTFFVCLYLICHCYIKIVYLMNFSITHIYSRLNLFLKFLQKFLPANFIQQLFLNDHCIMTPVV